MARNQLNLVTGTLTEDPNVMESRAGNTYATFRLRVKQPYAADPESVGGYGEREDVIEFLCFGLHAERLEDTVAGDLLTVQFNINIDENEGNQGQVFRNVKLMVSDFITWGDQKPHSPVSLAARNARIGTVIGSVANDNIVRYDKEGNPHFNLQLNVYEEFRRRKPQRDNDPLSEPWETVVNEAQWPINGFMELIGPRTPAGNLQQGDIVIVHYIVTGSEYETRDGAKRVSNNLYANEIIGFEGARGADEAAAADVFATDPKPSSNIDDLDWETE